MSTFIGKYEVKADVKGRVFIPSVYRKLIPESEKSKLVMRKHASFDCYVLFPERVWNKKVEELQERLDDWNADDQLVLMQFVSDAEWVEMDSQGRILLSKKQMELLGVENSEVLFVGMLDRIVIWGKIKFENVQLGAENFGKTLQQKMIKRD